jgi:hypothetical protein
MDTKYPTAVGIRKDVRWHGVYFTGPTEALIEAGICTADQVPGMPGNNKTSITRRLGRGRKFSVELQRRGELRVYVSRQELQARTPCFGDFMDKVLAPGVIDIPRSSGTVDLRYHQALLEENPSLGALFVSALDRAFDPDLYEIEVQLGLRKPL